jgi:hypothetical protein
MTMRTVTRYLSLGVALALAPGALADLSDISDVIFRIEASNDSGTGVLEFTKDQLTYNPSTDTYTWNTGTQFIFDEFFNPIATLQNANLALQMNDLKKVAGAFAVQAGDTDTTFTLTLAQLTFDTLSPPLVMGTAGLAANVTDTNGDGVTMASVAAATGVLRTGYNGMVPGGTPFVELLGELSVPAGSGSLLDYVPYTAIPDAVDDMNSQISFTLTAGDLGGGTHYFQLIPEPASLGLLLGGLLMLVRRR